MERTKIERPDGSVTLMVSGPSGAVTLDARDGVGQPWGVLNVHRPPGDQDEAPQECDVLEGGLCRPDASFKAGMALAPLVFSGREEEAWDEVEEWYRDRIGGDER